MPVIGRTENPENCRTCVDFKTWTKQQKKSLSSSSEKKDVKKQEIKEVTDDTPQRPDCPLDRDSLGRSTWSLLHTIAANYPEQPTQQHQSDIKTFISTLSRLYPCEYCAKDFRKELKESPPETKDQQQLSQWLCKMHNKVNIKLGKPEFDCNKVNERWRDGWLDGSCD